jgi:hypothetical protein
MMGRKWVEFGREVEGSLFAVLQKERGSSWYRRKVVWVQRAGSYLSSNVIQIPHCSQRSS